MNIMMSPGLPSFRQRGRRGRGGRRGRRVRGRRGGARRALRAPPGAHHQPAEAEGGTLR